MLNISIEVGGIEETVGIIGTMKTDIELETRLLNDLPFNKRKLPDLPEPPQNP